MTNNHRELVARAHYEEYMRGVEDLEPSWDDLPDDHKDRMLGAMDAAIKAHLAALREPTPKMLEAAITTRCTAEYQSYRGFRAQARSLFKAMLKASGEEHAG